MRGTLGDDPPFGQVPPLYLPVPPALPNNLPAQLSAFIGRDREVAEVRTLVESARLVTLTGTGLPGQIPPNAGKQTYSTLCYAPSNTTPPAAGGGAAAGAGGRDEG